MDINTIDSLSVIEVKDEYSARKIGAMTARELGGILMGLGDRNIVFNFSSFEKRYSWDDTQKIELKNMGELDLFEIAIGNGDITIELINPKALEESVNKEISNKGEGEF